MSRKVRRLGCQRSCLDLSSVSAGQATLSAQHAFSACCGNIAVRQLRKESQSVYRRWWPKLIEAFPQKHVFVDMSVFLWLRKQRPRFAQGQPKSNFQMKELDRTAKTIVPICPNEWNVEKAECQPFTWRNLQGCMNLQTVYAATVLGPLVTLLKAKTSNILAKRNGQDSPKASPRAIFKGKNLIEPLKLLSQRMKCGESWMSTCANMCHYAPTWVSIAVCSCAEKDSLFVPICANMCHYVPTWANIAVCQLCTERHPMRNSGDDLDQCHGVRSQLQQFTSGWWFMQVCL